MMIFDIILVFFAKVSEPPLIDRINGYRFSLKKVSAVLFILQDVGNSGFPPYITAFGRSVAFICQLPADHSASGTFQEPFENISDDLCLFFIDRQFPAFFVIIITEAGCKTDDFTSFHLHGKALFHVCRNIFHFLLRY